MFEGWLVVKKDKYGLDSETYDHTDITHHPPILIQCYNKYRAPFITILHLWDVKSDGILSVRYYLVNIRDDEAGMPSTKLKDSPPYLKDKAGKMKHEEGNLGLQDVFKSVIEVCRDAGKRKKSNSDAISI